MAFNKIQPQQFQLPTFLSLSGDATFTDNVTGVDITLNRDLSGIFNFADGLLVNSGEIIATSNLNLASGTNMVLGGSSSEATTGDYNTILNGKNNFGISGNYNTIVNGQACNFGTGSDQNTILAGKSATFSDNTTGSVIIADFEGAVTNGTNHSMVVSFASGVTFESSPVTFNLSSVYFKEDFFVDAGITGVFSGDIDVFGDAYVSGDLHVSGELFADALQTSDVFYAPAVDVTGEISGVCFTVSGQSHFEDTLLYADGISGTGDSLHYGNYTFEGAQYNRVRVSSELQLSDGGADSRAASERFVSSGLGSAGTSDGFIQSFGYVGDRQAVGYNESKVGGIVLEISGSKFFISGIIENTTEGAEPFNWVEND